MTCSTQFVRSPFGRLMRVAALPMLRSPMDRFMEMRAAVLRPGDSGARACVCANIVALGSTVVIEDLTAGRTRDVVLVEPEEANASRGLISVLAPLGTALLGAAEGETVVVERPQGETTELRITAVLPPDRGAA